MAGRPSTVSIFEGRRTTVRLDPAIYYTTEPLFVFEQKAEEIGKQYQAPHGAAPSSGGSSGDYWSPIYGVVGQIIPVHYVPGEGWELKPYQVDLNYAHERTETSGSTMLGSNGAFSLAANVKERDVFRSATELTGGTTGASGSLLSSGDTFLQLSVPQTDSFASSSSNLSADVTAFPSPVSAADYAMNRIAVGTEDHDPNRAFTFRFFLAGFGIQASDVVCVKFFSGPPTNIKSEWSGTGKYSIIFKGYGGAILAEYGRDEANGANKWRTCATFHYAEAHRTIDQSHRVYVRPILYKKKRGNLSGSILILTESQESPHRPNTVGTLHASANTDFQLPNTFKYFAQHDAESVSAPSAPMRIEIGRPYRPHVQTQLCKYPTTGDVWGSSFAMPFYPTSLKDITLSWFGEFPSSCDIEGFLYYHEPGKSLDGVELTVTVSATPIIDGSGNVIGGYKKYNVDAANFGRHTFMPKFTLTGPGTKTPILVRYRADRSQVTAYINPGETEAKAFESISLSGAGFDPSSETGSMIINDLPHAMTILNQRGSIPVIVQTTYDPLDSTKHSILFRGMIEVAHGTKHGSKMPKGRGSTSLLAYPDPDWKQFECTLVSEWRRIEETLTPIRFTFVDSDGKPFKVTEMLHALFKWAGYQEDEIDIPDSDLRLFASDNDSLVVQPQTSIAPLILRLARDYLGRYIVWDKNASGDGSNHERGCWRVLNPPTPTYENLAAFTLGGPKPGVGVKALNHVVAAYGTTTNPSGTVVQGCFIQKGTFRTHVRRPSANKVTVWGTGNDVSGTSKGPVLRQIPNPRSYNFAGLSSSDPNYPDPTDPDYLPRVVELVVDLKGAGQDMVDWFARRVFDRTCHGAKCATFVAPLLLVTDATDTKQIRPRPLRFYDPVTIDGEQYLVRSVHPSYQKDSVQMAVYEVEAPNGMLL